MAKIAAVNPAAAEYLRSIPAELWAVAHFPRTRYGHLTSNIAESVNKILCEDRSLSIIELLDAIWHRVMTDRASRLREAQKQTQDGLVWTSYCRTKLEYGRCWAHSNRASIASSFKAFD